MQPIQSMNAEIESYLDPTILNQHRLLEYAKIKLGSTASASPWTFLYREFIDPTDNKRGAECTGVVVPLLNGRHSVIRTSEMVRDQVAYQKALAHFKPGPRPTIAQKQAISRLKI